MVVLAASICTKAGKAVLSRQFVEMPRSRIEGLIASFPKLIGASDQHTYVETDSVRYVYQPLENLFMVLVTTKNSNILQDIDTLHLFARIVSEYCRSNDEREIAKHAFDLLLVFDEVISLGYRENINLGQIRTISTMESHEERIQAEIEKNKQREAKEELKRRAKQIDMQKRDASKRPFGGNTGGFGVGSSVGMGGGSSGAGGFSNNSFSSQAGSGFGAAVSAGVGVSQPSAGAYGQTFGAASATPVAVAAAAPASSTGGMRLGGGQRHNTLLESISAYEGIKAPSNTASASAPSQAKAVAREDSVHIVVEEKISVATSRDGGLQSLEVNGSMMLKINDAAVARARVAITHSADPNIRFTTHPNVDKALWGSDSIVALKDPARPFPVGQALGILRWKMSSRSEAIVPLVINCWPSPTGNGSCDVNVEYELQNTSLELHDVVISIPYPGTSAPTVGDVEGHYQIDRQRRVVQWSLPLIDTSNASGVLEFHVGSDDVNSFYPIQIMFTSSKLLSDIQVAGVQVIDGGNASFSLEQSLKADVYQVV